eukprot:497035-Prorocentrum_minimum.AAC.1
MVFSARVLAGEVRVQHMACITHMACINPHPPVADGSIDERAFPVVHPVDHSTEDVPRMYQLFKCELEGVQGYSERECRELTNFLTNQLIAQGKQVFEIRSVDKSKANGKGMPRTEDFEAKVAEIVLSTQEDMDGYYPAA